MHLSRRSVFSNTDSIWLSTGYLDDSVDYDSSTESSDGEYWDPTWV